MQIPPSTWGYVPNHPAIERLVSQIGRTLANVTEIRWPKVDTCPELDPQWDGERHYLSRDAYSYDASELPMQVALDAQAAQFLFNILVRNWDACVLNMAVVRDLPVLFDFGESLNPALYPIERFTQVISRPHAMGHYCETYQYAAAYRSHLRKHVMSAVERLHAMRPSPAELAQRNELPELLAGPITTYLESALDRLESDVEYVLREI